jgi:DNA-binding LytR/AlgR family response regulator
MDILIIEDEPLAAKKLEALVQELSTEHKIVAQLESVDESIQWLESNDHPDLILSDIHLSDGICFNIYSRVKVTCPIVFTTAYEKYAIQAFEVNSVDYLLKPIQKERLANAINKVEALPDDSSLSKSVLFEEFKNLLSSSNRDYKSRFLCKIGNKIKSIPIENINYFYSKDKMSFIVDQNANRYPVNNTLDELDQLVDPKSFFRVNRKYIVNFEALDEISPYFKGRLKLKLRPNVDDDIIVSTERSPIFKSWLDR